jgi:glyoxylase-like metal-dependent hydrolase (beta-lactamase superfamily II)
MWAAQRRTIEVAPGIHLLRRVRGCNVYYLADPDNPALIDSGLPWTVGRLLRTIAEFPPEWPPPKRLLITHYHIDHAGGAVRLRQAFGTSVVTHPAETKAFVDRLLRDAPLPWRVRRYTMSTAPDEVVEDGTVLPVLGGLEVVHTPGHTPGSLCFYLREQGVLFTGDQFISYIDRLSRPFMGVEGDRGAYRESLARIAALRPAVLLPGHGYPVLQDAADLLEEMVARGGGSAGKRAWVKNVPRLVRFTFGMWRDRDLPRAPRQRPGSPQ